MNVVREIHRINQAELDIAISNPSASWHAQYSDSAYIFIGGLPYDLTEGDVITIFSQYGEVVDVNLPRPTSTPQNDDKKDAKEAPKVGKGKHRGFGFLMYEDQRSTVLAVDNLNGAQVLGRTLRVDHVASYKQPKVRDEDGELVEVQEKVYNAAPELVAGREEEEDEEEGQGDLEDPMASYFQRLKKEEKGKGKDVDGGQEKEEKRRRKEERARIRAEREERKRASSSRHKEHSADRHRRSHNDDEDDRDRKRRSSHRDESDEGEGVNRYEQVKKRSILDLDHEEERSSRHGSPRHRSRTPEAHGRDRHRGGSDRRYEHDRRGEGHEEERNRRHRSSHHSSSHSRRRSRSPR